MSCSHNWCAIFMGWGGQAGGLPKLCEQNQVKSSSYVDIDKRVDAGEVLV